MSRRFSHHNIIYDYSRTKLKAGEIRLLKLLAGSKTALLEGNIVRYSLNNTSPPETSSGRPAGPSSTIQTFSYDALSYTWGTGDEKDVIKILDENDIYVIPIKPNLDAALRQLRSSRDHRYLWIDAICINQKDHAEKSSQIPKISEIYGKADHVHIWLGIEEDNSADAMKFIEKCLDLDKFDQLVQDSLVSKEWAAFSALMRRPWFNRRWIVQELARAKHATLHCGKDSIEWQEFADVVSLFKFKEDEIRKLFRESTEFRNHPDYIGDLTELGAFRLAFASDNIFRKSDTGQILERLLSLEALMSSLSTFEASDPRDVVYAILWLASDARPSTKDAFVMHTDLIASPVTYLNGDTELSADHRRRKSTTCLPTNSPPLPVLGSLEGKQTLSNGEPVTNRVRASGQIVVDTTITQPQQGATDPARPPKVTIDTAGSRSASEDDVRKRKVASKFMRAVMERRIIVDYEKSVFQVCKDFLEFVIPRSNSLDMICRPWAPDDPDLPSWIPRVSKNSFRRIGKNGNGVYRRVNADPLVGRPGLGEKPYRAAKNTRAFWKPKLGAEKSLMVTGFVLDTVKQKMDPATAGSIPGEWPDAIDWADPAVSPPDRFWRTLVGNRDAHGQRPPPHWKRVCHDAFNRRPPGADLNIGETLTFGCASPIRQYLERVQCVVFRRRLLLFDRLGDSLGLGPIETKENDLVCILNGCSVPVLLRKYVGDKPANKSRAACSPGNESDVNYRFIGECYVHGIMDGEAFRFDERKERDFELR